jgi:hypothetical protein
MQWTVSTWNEFRDAWDGVHNFLLAGECVPFADFEVPPLDRVVAELREDAEARITPGLKGPTLRMESTADAFRALPIDRALASPFSLAHFKLSNFDRPGGVLHGIREHVLEPWQAALRDAGFTFDRCYPIVFISGPQCASNYHMDFSHVLAWQVYGTKRFCGLKSPGRWAPWRARVTYDYNRFTRPSGIGEDDTLAYVMRPGDALWNVLLTPHWVEASDEPAMSINLSHGGLRLHGRLCPFERELEEYQAAHPAEAPAKVEGKY